MTVTETPTDSTNSQQRPASADESTTNHVQNGITGGIAGLLLSFLPFSTVLGGAVAGYLTGGTYADGARTGAVTGATFLVPLAALGVAATVLPGVAVPGPTLPLGLFLAAVATLALVYVVGLSVLGGVLGVYVRTEV